MAEFKLIVSKPNIKLDLIESKRSPYCWAAQNFPLILESFEPNPFDLAWDCEIKVMMGKPRDLNLSKYPSKVRISMRSQVKDRIVSSRIDWICDTGKLAYYPYPCKFAAVFPGDRGGWLILAVVANQIANQ